MLQVTFMGTGAAFSTARRTNIAILVQAGDTKILLECGPNILHQLDQAGSAADQIDYMFISHRHGDHLLGLPLFLGMRTSRGASGNLTIFGGADVIQAGQDLTRLVFPELAARLSSLVWKEIPVDRPASVKLGSSIQLSTTPTPHSPDVASLAVRIDVHNSGRSLVYTGDTMFSEDMASFASGCDLLVHEANFSEALHPQVKADDYGHSTALQAGLAASGAKCGTLALVHLSPEYFGQEDQVRAEAAKAYDGRIIIPTDGATLYL